MLSGCPSPPSARADAEALGDTTAAAAAVPDTVGAVAQNRLEPVSAVADTLALPFHSIPGLHALAPTTGRFNTRGYVIEAPRPCPPCPPGAQCTPCVPYFIILAVRPDVVPAGFDVGDTAPDQIRIRTHGPEGFRVGVAYALSVEVVVWPGEASPRRLLSFDNVVLLGATPLP